MTKLIDLSFPQQDLIRKMQQNIAAKEEPGMPLYGGEHSTAASLAKRGLVTESTYVRGVGRCVMITEAGKAVR